MKHNILVLEDSANRIDLFKREISATKYNLVIAKTVDDAICEFNKENNWPVVLLDHDLKDEHYLVQEGDDVAKQEGTGYEFCKFLILPENAVKLDTILIHSLNYVGASNMFHLLNSCEHLKDKVINKIPFNVLFSLIRFN